MEHYDGAVSPRGAVFHFPLAMRTWDLVVLLKGIEAVYYKAWGEREREERNSDERERGEEK